MHLSCFVNWSAEEIDSEHFNAYCPLKVIHTKTNLQLLGAVLFKYVCY